VAYVEPSTFKAAAVKASGLEGLEYERLHRDLGKG
jgi:hypothetical protein